MELWADVGIDNSWTDPKSKQLHSNYSIDWAGWRAAVHSQAAAFGWRWSENDVRRIICWLRREKSKPASSVMLGVGARER